MLVLMIDIFITSAAKSLREKLFKALAIMTIFTIISDIISSYAMMHYQTTSWWFLQGSLVIYFILTPMLSVLWQLYAITVVKNEVRSQKIQMYITSIPFIAYVMIVLSNPYTGWIFELSSKNEYTRGSLFDSVFLMFYGYSVLTLVLAWVNFKKTERATSIVLIIYPIISSAGVCMQQMMTGYLITGASFTLVILIVYLFLQNRKATRDNLTGLFNRLEFTNAVDLLSKKHAEGAILAVAIDDFKMFNQTFGQKNGDLLLQTISEYLVTISPNKTCYRYGGDIFTIILKNHKEQESLKLASEIMNRFAETFHIANIGYSISVSIGIVEYPHSSNEENYSTITALDFSIYQAKKRGKGQIAFFNEELLQQLKRKYEIMEAITYAVKHHSFEVFIQPIYHLKEKKYLFAEALLRLNDKKLGWISPTEFISIAEETGEIVDITYFVLEKVCTFIEEHWQVLEEQSSVSVNFSIIQFMQNDMVERVKTIIQRHHIAPSLIKIEITESLTVDSFDDIKNAMHELNVFGIQFALDDYGQGYSNISYLLNLPFSVVKLDKSIIDNITENQNFISALILMFKSLNKKLIAEGVETKEQADILEKLSCDAIQGYYYAKPMPMELAAEVFANK